MDCIRSRAEGENRPFWEGGCLWHGLSVHAWIKIPDVPRLDDGSATGGDLGELDGAIVIHLDPGLP